MIGSGFGTLTVAGIHLYALELYVSCPRPHPFPPMCNLRSAMRYTDIGIYPIGSASWLFVLCGVVSTQSPITIGDWILCTFTLLSNA